MRPRHEATSYLPVYGEVYGERGGRGYAAGVGVEGVAEPVLRRQKPGAAGRALDIWSAPGGGGSGRASKGYILAGRLRQPLTSGMAWRCPAASLMKTNCPPSPVRSCSLALSNSMP